MKVSSVPAILVFLACLVGSVVGEGAIKLNADNFDHVISSTELVFVNFYADWCRFSGMLAPIWDKTAEMVTQKLDKSRVTIAKVDSDSEEKISSKYHISKYPTLKLFRFGQPAKKEYRGQRSEQAFTEFLKQELDDPVRQIHALDDVKEDVKGQVIGYFTSQQSPNYQAFKKMAYQLKDECPVLAGFGSVFSALMTGGSDMVVVRPPSSIEDIALPPSVSISDSQQLTSWAQRICVPLVGVITFENAEELTEAGNPFLILFHHPNDEETPRKYREFIKNNLYEEKSGITFLTADGLKFAHPLHHLGKSKQDLPLIAIDSFRHMYVFPDIKDMEKPGKLKQFIDDLHSGKLHREFHYGPSEPVVIPAGSSGQPRTPPTTPPESVFKKLGPSSNRYSIKDEL